MKEWQVVLDEAAFHALLALPTGRRRSAVSILERFKSNPYQEFEYEIADTTGRKCRRKLIRPFLITYWLDDSVLELRIIDIELIRF